MKILKKVLILVLVCILPLCVATACAPKTCTITFLQDGQEAIVRTVEKGSDLTDIPTPASVTGYDVVWDVTDFTNIQEDMTVNAVTTGKTFTITYVISDFAEGKGVTLDSLTQTVTYGQAFTLKNLPTYTFEGVEYVLTAWLLDGVEFTNGSNWDKLNGITLTMAHFEPVQTPEWIS